MRGCAIVVASSCNSLQWQKIASGWWLGIEAGRSLGICSVFEFILIRTDFINKKVCPKEGTRVRIPGMYHITTWYGAVGH